jgi:hypothetical protein
MWTDIAPEEVLQSLSQKQIKRQEVIFGKHSVELLRHTSLLISLGLCVELIKTEENFMRDLHALQKVFFHPMRMLSLLSKEDLTLFFSNIDELVAVNECLLGALRRRQSESGPVINHIGDIFLEHVRFTR